MGYSPEQKELLDAIQIMIDGAMSQIPIITNGHVVESLGNNVYRLKVNGKEYDLPHYGTSTVAVNSIVKVFVPYNNYSMAWFI